MNKEEEKELEENKQILQNAILKLFATYNANYGSVKKFKREDNLIIIATTGGYSDNEEAIEEFNKTNFLSITIRWWFLYEWRRGGYFKWKIPLFLVKNFDAKKS